jgi:hypothetical protein
MYHPTLFCPENSACDLVGTSFSMSVTFSCIFLNSPFIVYFWQGDYNAWIPLGSSDWCLLDSWIKMSIFFLRFRKFLPTISSNNLFFSLSLSLSLCLSHAHYTYIDHSMMSFNSLHFYSVLFTFIQFFFFLTFWLNNLKWPVFQFNDSFYCLT